MLIGITGRKQHGKSTVSRMISSEYGFHIVSFAMPLKEVLCYIFGWKYVQWEDGDWKEAPQDICYGLTPRDLALSIGTAWGRGMVHENLWADAAMRAVDRSLCKYNVVMPDVRFDNEAEAIKRRNGFIISVERTDVAGPHAESMHVSEQGINPALIDYWVAAKSGEIDTLKGLVRSYIERHLP